MTANSPTPSSHTFTDAEVAYLADQPLGRIATVGVDGTPHVVPVGFLLRSDQGVIDIGGLGLTSSKKWRDLTANPRVALVVDDLESVDPWTPRGVEVRGRADLHEAGGRNLGPGFGRAWIRIHPERIIAWGVDGDPLTGPTAVTSTDDSFGRFSTLHDPRRTGTSGRMVSAPCVGSGGRRHHGPWPA